MSRIFYAFFVFSILLFQQVVFADNIKKDLYSQKNIDQVRNVDNLISGVNDQNTTIKLRGTAKATELDNFFIKMQIVLFILRLIKEPVQELS